MMTVFEVFSALFGLFLLGNVHSAWQTNPILSHPLGRFAIAFVIISAILGWNYYQNVQEDINKAKDKIAEDKKIEHEDWTFAKQINTENLRADAQAMFLQGSNYAKGKGGVAQNFELACEWFKKAAAEGSKEGKKYAHSTRCKRLL